MASFEHASGIAGEIRSSLVSDQFDLGGYTEIRAHDLIRSAFSTALTAPTEMVKFTFVVGGGKLVRSRYPEELTKWLVAALREIGFQEDRSAAETFDSQGTFKQQHDTGQNLKYLIIYPRVACAPSKASASSSSASATAAAAAAVNPHLMIDSKSPEGIILASELATFQEIIASKATSYAQKKKILKFLQEKHETFQAIEGKLVAGQALSPEEQSFYDNNSGQDQEKITWLQNAIKDMVDHSQLTKPEKEDLIKQIAHNIDTTKQEIETAKTENKPKKVEKLEAKLQTLLQREEYAKKMEANIQHRLKHGEQISTLYMKVLPLQALEEKSRSMSLTLADLKALEEKSDLEVSIKELEHASREWFVEDAVFEELCKQEEKNAKLKFKARQQQKGNSAGKSGATGTTGKVSTKSSSTSSGWTTAGKKPAGAWGAGGASGASKAKGSSSGFAGLNDGDSD